MSQKRSGLGRNLSALLSQSAVQLQPSVAADDNVQIEYRPIANLVPGQYQPRRVFSDETIAELADSIQKQGLLQPLVVRELQADQYEIIAGERRWRACQLIGMSQVPVLIRTVNDETALALALIENLQREDLSSLDQARSMQRLLVDFSLSHQQIADVLSKSRTTVTNHLRLLNLSAEVQMFLEQGSLEMGHARSLLTLPEKEQKRIANKVVTKGLSVRETERLVTAAKATHTTAKQVRIAASASLHSQIQAVAKHLQTEVRMRARDAERGTLVIHYSDMDSLNKIIAKIIESEK